MTAAWSYWTTFEWLGWDVYREHRRRIGLAWQLDPLFWLRILLIVSSLGTAAALLWPDEMFSNAAGYHYIRAIIEENTLGMVFLLHGVGLIWRLYAYRRRFEWTAALAVIGMIVYFGVPICVYLDLGHITMAGISMMAMGLGCWILVAKGRQFLGAE